MRVLDNLNSGTLRNLKLVYNEIEFIRGDIRDKCLVQKAVKDVDYILHHAALTSVEHSLNDPNLTNSVNIEGTMNLLTAAKDTRVKRFIYASSAAVYGNNGTIPTAENTELEPLSPYAVSKLTGEEYCKMFHRTYGLRTVCFRYFNIFGPQQDPNSQYAAVIPKFIHNAYNDVAPTIYGDGLQTRDFTYVDDVVNVNLLACQANASIGETFNIGSGTRFSLLELIENLNNILSKKLEPKFEKSQEGDIKHSQADIGKAKELLNYQPSPEFKLNFEHTVHSVTQTMSEATAIALE